MRARARVAVFVCLRLSRRRPIADDMTLERRRVDDARGSIDRARSKPTRSRVQPSGIVVASLAETHSGGTFMRIATTAIILLSLSQTTSCSSTGGSAGTGTNGDGTTGAGDCTIAGFLAAFVRLMF